MKFYRTAFAVLTALTVTNCGWELPQSEEDKPDNKDNNQQSEELRIEGEQIQVLLNEQALPKCEDATRRHVYYLMDSKEFHYCAKTGWKTVDLKGRDGADGRNGFDGQDGEDGANGATGASGRSGYNTLASMSSFLRSSYCPAGGLTITTGLDYNRDGSLQSSEVTRSGTICHGEKGDKGDKGDQGDQGDQGDSGLTSLILLTNLNIGDDDCPGGGVMIQAGLDTNRNDVLEAGEVTQTSFVCSPADDGVEPPGETVGIDFNYTLSTASIVAVNSTGEPGEVLINNAPGKELAVDFASGRMFTTNRFYEVREVFEDGSSEVISPDDVSWPEAAAVDSRRNRLTIISSFRHAYFYSLDTGEWVEADFGAFVGSGLTMDYDAEADEFILVSTSYLSQGDATLYFIDADTLAIKRQMDINLANTDTFGFGDYGHTQLRLVEGQILISGHMAVEHNSSRVMKRTVYMIDRATGEASISYETNEIEDEDPEVEMHIVGVYEGAGNGLVHVNTGAPTILVLTSYEQASWKVTLGQGTEIKQIILSGYESQSVSNAQEFEGLITTMDLSFAYTAPSSRLTQMEYKLHSATRNAIDSFNGAYRGSNFTVE